MKNFCLIVLFLFTLSDQLSAYTHPSPGNWAVEGSFLYLLPMVEDTYFVVESVASTSGSILASKAHQQFTSVVDAVLIQDVDDEDTWRLIPAWHARLGVNYQACIFYCRASLEVGYEFHTYLRSFTRIGFPDNLGTSLCYTNYCNFSMQGFYAAATLSF